MTAVMANAPELVQDTGAHVMFVHHTSAADPTKARGSTALVGNADTVLVLKPISKTGVFMETLKQRSMSRVDDIGFEIVSVDYGVDGDGDGDMVTNSRADLVKDTTGWTDPTAARKGNSSSQVRANDVLRTLGQLEAEAEAEGAPVVFRTKEVADHFGASFERDNMKP